jgi:hypothetical protein
MKQYALLFRMDILNPESQPTKKQMQVYMQQWQEWINDINQNGQLDEGGSHFSHSGRVIKSNKQIIESPYVAENISVAGYIMILANNLNDATIIANKCPILNGQNTSVEIREIVAPGL